MARRKNPEIAAAQLGPINPVMDGAEANRLNARTVSEDRPDPYALKDVASKLAGHPTSCRNWKFKNADKHFPADPEMRRVDRYFPYAEGGPLLVDEPISENDVKRCEKKAPIIASEGQRYVFLPLLKDGEIEEDRLYHARVHLKALDQKGVA